MKDFLRGPYFKVYGNITNNPKVAGLSDFAFRIWVELMAVASDHFGYSGEDCKITFTVDKLAWYMGRRDPATLPVALAEMERARLIRTDDIGIEIHEWEFWQLPTTKAEHNHNSNRSRALRNAKKRTGSKVKQGEESLKQSDSRVKLIDSKVKPSEVQMTPPNRTEPSEVGSLPHSVEAAPPTGGLLAAQAPIGEPEHLRLAKERSVAEFYREQAEWEAKKAAEAALKPAVAVLPKIVIPPKTVESIRLSYDKLRQGQLTAEDRLALDKAEKRELARLMQ